MEEFSNLSLVSTNDGITKLCEMFDIDCAYFRSNCDKGGQQITDFIACIREFSRPSSASQVKEAPASQADAQAIDNPPLISTPEYNQLGLSDDGIAGHQFDTARFNQLCV